MIVDTHSAHISKEINAWLAKQPVGRFQFTFTPAGSWLNLIEGLFSKFARSVLRYIRVESKEDLKDRNMVAKDYFNQEPVVGPTDSTGPSGMIRAMKSMYEAPVRNVRSVFPFP